jgi:hypothetical protein
MITGHIELDLGNLQYVRGSGLNRAIRVALNKATVPAKAAVVAAAPERTGFLKRAMRIKTQFKKGVWSAVVGPSTKVKKLKKKKQREKQSTTTTTTTRTPKARAKRKKTKLGRFIARARKVGAKRASRAKKVAAKKAKALRKGIVRTKFFKNLVKKFKKKPGINDYIRPSRYGSILQFGSTKLQARHYIERAYSRCGNEFQTILTTKLREQLAQMMSKK